MRLSQELEVSTSLAAREARYSVAASKIRLQAVCADLWLEVGTSHARSQAKFLSLCYSMLWVRLGAPLPGSHALGFVQPVPCWPVTNGVPDKWRQTLHSTQVAENFSSLGADGELSRSELKRHHNCTSSLCQKRTQTCRFHFSRCSVQDSIARVALVIGSPGLLGL